MLCSAYIFSTSLPCFVISLPLVPLVFKVASWLCFNLFLPRTSVNQQQPNLPPVSIFLNAQDFPSSWSFISPPIIHPILPPSVLSYFLIFYFLLAVIVGVPGRPTHFIFCLISIYSVNENGRRVCLREGGVVISLTFK